VAVRIRLEATDVAELDAHEAALRTVLDIPAVASRDYPNRRRGGGEGEPGWRRYLDSTGTRTILAGAVDAGLRLEQVERYEARVLAAVDALTEVLDDPELGTYPPSVAALLDALDWLEIEVTCGDCVEGRCHWGGDRSRASIAAVQTGHEYVDPTYGRCGCARHDASVQARQRRIRLRAAGVVR
jgi:hypothetical protein